MVGIIIPGYRHHARCTRDEFTWRLAPGSVRPKAAPNLIAVGRTH